jgi:protein RecA
MAKDKPKKDESIDRETLLKKTLRDVDKMFPGALQPASAVVAKERIPFPLEELNKLTGGGIPSGTFSVIWGNKSSGKTTMVYSLIAEAQKMGKKCAMLDIENSFDGSWAAKAGVNLDTLLVGNKFKTAEEAMDTLIKLTQDQVVDFIIVDSIQALSPQAEQQDKKGQKSTASETMALLARKLSQFFRMCAGDVARGKVAVLLIGQARTSLGGYVALETLSGGHALQHWSSMTIHIRRGQKKDAPVEKYKETFIDPETQKERYKTKARIIGFNCVIKLEKTKLKSEVEGSERQLPFYLRTGFTKPEGVELVQNAAQEGITEIEEDEYEDISTETEGNSNTNAPDSSI